MTQKSVRPISPLYAHYLTSDEKKSLRAVSADNPASEINLLRVLFAHFMEFQQSAPKDTNSRMQALHTCLILSEQIAKLVHVHNKEHDPLCELEDEILKALGEIRSELGID